MPKRINYGFDVPISNDRGQELFAVLDAYFERQVNHDHDDISGQKINYRNIDIPTTTIIEIQISEQRVEGYHRLEVDLPAGYNLGTNAPVGVLESGETFALKILPVPGSLTRISILLNERFPFKIVWS